MFIVYALYSEKHGVHYVGYTSDLESRLLSHTELVTKELYNSLPPLETKSEAMKRAKHLKKKRKQPFVKKRLTINLVS